MAQLTQSSNTKKLADMTEKEVNSKYGPLWGLAEILDEKQPKKLDKTFAQWFKEALNLLKTGAARLFTAIYGKFQICGNMVAWLKDTVFSKGAGIAKRFGFELAGNLSKFCRTLGLVGSVLGMVSLYEKMQEAHDETNDDERREALLNRIQFWMGVAEVVLGVAFDRTVSVRVCGGCRCLRRSWAFTGVAGIVILIVFVVVFKPDKYKDVRKFLEKVAEHFGSYGEEETSGHGHGHADDKSHGDGHAVIGAVHH